MDHTCGDITFIDEITGMPWGRPTGTISIDFHTKSPPGLYLCPRPPGVHAALGCLRHSCLPKLALPDNIENPWPSYGIPQKLVVDNGAEFHATGYMATLADLGVELDYCGSGQAPQKGTIERFIGTMNTELLHLMPGTTFSRYEDLGAYNPDKTATYSLQGFCRALYQWICDIYHESPCAKNAKTPREMWEESAHISAIRLPRDPRLLERLLGHNTACSLSKGPILVDGIKYTSRELGELRKMIGVRETVAVRYFDEDLSFIEVINPLTKQPIRVPAEDMVYTKGLNRYLHQLVKARIRIEYSRKKRKLSLIAARLQIAQETQVAYKLRTNARRKNTILARGISSANPAGQPLIPEIDKNKASPGFLWDAMGEVETDFDWEEIEIGSL